LADDCYLCGLFQSKFYPEKLGMPCEVKFDPEKSGCRS